ncbi:RNA 2',3'-cyclic phosphodiesterase [Angustibacter sp. Root456]|uniref:RNA 2',3'-cyclic phosphodiesterase n=1 Tax=Angustibacter sp. Root456 TaxID=1736539 RepID=UPI0006F3922D|nr:RNA 2',3'-cyclic phosphodiesterase [Angustibacter sp. Root456]KQX69740.1 2'-5' RNA ligase [Angustibacter sp. Root456]
MAAGQRMFVALTPSREAIEDLEEFLEPRRAADRDLRWSASEQWHVTLAFLAQVPDRCLDDLVDRLARAARRRTAFVAALRGGGAFPHSDRAKVLFTGVDVGEHGGTLHRLSDSVRAAASRAGAPPDGARFHPHVTLARTSRPMPVVRWVRLLDTYAGPLWAIDELHLIASHLGEGPRRRPRYEVVATLPFAGESAGASTGASD